MKERPKNSQDETLKVGKGLQKRELELVVCEQREQFLGENRDGDLVRGLGSKLHPDDGLNLGGCKCRAESGGNGVDR